MTTTLIQSVTLPNGNTADILLAEGDIRDIAEAGSITAPSDAEVINAEGLIALPGLVDPHTHLREPGREDAETVETGTQAAAAGGFVAVYAMANSMPVADTAGVVESVRQLGEEAGWAEVRPIGAVTQRLAGERLAELGAMADSHAQVRMFSDDGMCVFDPVLMRRALEYVRSFDGVVAQHAQEPRLTEGAQMNEGIVSSELGLTGWPAVAEESIIARDVLLTQHVNSRLHVCHVSTKGSVEIIRWAKSQGIDVTAEVTPHHLLLTEEMVRGYDPVFKVNPPLRTKEDTLALREAVADGTIDMIGTDHAPHTSETKQCAWNEAAMGMTGLETALPVVQKTLVDTGMITWEDVARIMSTAPAKLIKATNHGQPLEVGSVANVTLYDPSAVRVVNPEEHHTKGRNSPYKGLELPGKVMHTFYAGHATVVDGELASPRKVIA
ncbi:MULTISPECIES: dihydroorotase [Micrococcaceae]|uniref:Dihydroorotase n=1 Tax=Pseudoglutamicibacter albus DNF00011 TaxID=1401063 RepID=A0A096AIP4_9MICC|nr:MULTISPECIES: dihydroorotase [Micrococcaceae]KGF20824.1 dihydroorotase [Pseudoglutamicibacter albus DNF00011]MCG7304217.1 dihydroorotase [Pseudoglutamicibacter albus]OFT22274.1 dihydroorotase [Arthrobacter sp. HMSC08H08]OFT41167.1 dihydroorotase [Arthrobacter sp. HMSC06H05]